MAAPEAPLCCSQIFREWKQGIPRGDVNVTFLDIRFVYNAVANAELEYYSPP
jgi:hypothetical protein